MFLHTWHLPGSEKDSWTCHRGSQTCHSLSEYLRTFEQRHEKTYANNKSADQPAHLCSLISAFVRYLDSIISKVSMCTKPSLASFCSWAGQFESFLIANSMTGFLVIWLILYNCTLLQEDHDGEQYKVDTLTRITQACDILILLSFRAVVGFWKVVRSWDVEGVPQVMQAQDGGSMKGSFPPLIRGVPGISPAKFLRFRMSIDAFLVHAECIFGSEFQPIPLVFSWKQTDFI